MQKSKLGMVLAVVLGLAACGGSSKKKSPTPDLGTQDLATEDLLLPGDLNIVGDGGGPARATLTIKNYLNWCAVSANGTALTPGATETVVVTDGVPVTLNATPTGSFVWGYWAGTATGNDLGAHDLSQTISVTLTGDKTIEVCCPDSGSDCTF